MARIESVLHVTQARIERYGRANGDAEMLHYDAAHARARGFRGTIAHGTMLAAPLFELALRRHGERFLVAGSLSLKWTAPVCSGDVQLASIDDEGRIEAVIENQPGHPVSMRGESSCGGESR